MKIINCYDLNKMRLTKLIICSVIILMTSCSLNSEKEEVEIIKKWLSAWDYMSKSVQKIDNKIEVDYVLFNDKYVYSTSNITVPKGKEITIEGNKKKWYKIEHHGKIVLPNKEIFIPAISVFTIPSTKNNNIPFFVMPLNSFWEKNGLKSKNSTIENLTTAIFLHEFSHTQQLKTFGRKISVFEKDSNFKVDLTDNLIQDLYEDDINYKTIFQFEINHLYNAIENKNDSIKFKTNLKIGINYFKKRQAYFQNLKLVDIDNQFLTIEGLGQYLMYLWLSCDKGGALSKKEAIEEVRRNKRNWSQDEGLILFLIQDCISKNNEWLGHINQGTTITKQIENLIF